MDSTLSERYHYRFFVFLYIILYLFILSESMKVELNI